MNNLKTYKTKEQNNALHRTSHKVRRPVKADVGQKELIMNFTVMKYTCHAIIAALLSTVVLFVFFCTRETFAASEIPEPESWNFPDIVESARIISPRNVEGKLFDAFGLVYSSDELKKRPLDTMPPDELQKYADIVTHAYPDAVYRQFPASCEEISVNKLNETSVAGVAYVSLHAIDPDTREKAAACLKEIQRLLKVQSGSIFSEQKAQQSGAGYPPQGVGSPDP